MKVARNAFTGYSYQQKITFLLLAIMDSQRNFSALEMEVNEDHNFDDIKVEAENGDSYYFQIKDFESISIDDIVLKGTYVSLKSNLHKLPAKGINVLVFKDLEINPNFKLFGLDAHKTDNLILLSISRESAEHIIRDIYEANEFRIFELSKFFSEKLDSRNYRIAKVELPIIDVFDTELIEETVDLGRKHLEFTNILFIEGKPGVGKSHYVSTLSNIYKNKILYRFWVSGQDKHYNKRLLFKNFLDDISKQIFHTYERKTEQEIVAELDNKECVLIIDGLDHVENYAKSELSEFISFIEKATKKVKTIVLSRPLKHGITWKRQVLSNWNSKETQFVLEKLFHINDYSTARKIYELSQGYPILVRFLGEHYKIYGDVPHLNTLQSVDDYYAEIIKDVNTKSAMTLFLTCRSFFMKSEFSMFLENESLECLNEFVRDYPYLFEVRANRVSLFHDSLNKFLREQSHNYSQRNNSVAKIVTSSILNNEHKFLSRLSYFDIANEDKLQIIQKHSSLENFKHLIEGCIDFEAIRSFFLQIRESLNEISYEDLQILNYYDLALIINIVERDHVSSLNGLLYTYSKCLLQNGFSVEDITSSDYLFGMFLYCIEKDPNKLYNTTADSMYDTTRFLENLEKDIIEEETHFKILDPVKFKKTPEQNFAGAHWKELYSKILANLYNNRDSNPKYIDYQEIIIDYIDLNEKDAVKSLELLLRKHNKQMFFANWILQGAKKLLFSLGSLKDENPFYQKSLKNYILENYSKGSFDLSGEILDFIRLYVHEHKKIDISSIYLFWFMYYNWKDYSVVNIHTALTVFEKHDLIQENEAIRLILRAQLMSEKGIRHILGAYISEHPPEIIDLISKVYLHEEFNIKWFDLPKEHIDRLPEYIFNSTLSKVLQYHNYDKTIDFSEIKNVFHSNKKESLLEDLKFLKYKIRISSNADEVKELRKNKVLLALLDNVSETNRGRSEERFNRGILDKNDKQFIIDNNLCIQEIAGYLNGNYDSLAELELFEIFPKTVIKANIKEILHNALIGKLSSLNSFGYLFSYVGNVPKIISEYGNSEDLVELYTSFKSFLDISLIQREEQE